MKGNRGLMLLVIALIAGGLLVFYYTYFGSKTFRSFSHILIQKTISGN